MRTLTMAELAAAAGTTVGTSEWVTITQERIDQFADATNDRQWIHVDPVRAAEGRYGTTIGHGFLTLSLISSWMFELLQVTDAASAINYGVNRVRFPAPVPVGSRLRAEVSVAEVAAESDWVQAVFRFVIEIEGGTRPACVADSVVRFIPATSAT